MNTVADNKNITPLHTQGRIAPRSWLFVPASRPERFEKALTSGADAVIIDLEDAVSKHQKKQARQDIITVIPELINGSDRMLASLWIRIGGQVRTNPALYHEDIAICARLKQLGVLAGIVIPKVETTLDVSKVYADVQLPIVIQIESARGMNNIPDIAQADGLYAMSYGRLDIGNELNLTSGSQAEHDFIQYLRVQLMLHSKLNNLYAPIESIYADFNNIEVNQQAAEYAADMGFSGMLCIHPKQVALVNQAFKVSDIQLAFAKKVITHYQSTGDSVFAIDGQMVDLPVILQCQRLLETVR